MKRHFGLSIFGEYRPQNVPNERWNREAYEDAVVATLDQLMSTHTGRLVVRYAEMRPQQIAIYPMQRWTQGAIARATAALDAPPGAGSVNRCPLSFDGLRRPIPGGPLGTGEAVDAIVWFSPGLFRRHRVDEECRPEYRGPGFYGDAILLHELLHAIRWTHGVSDPSPRRFDYDSFEEVCAVFVTNMYRAELGRHLIASHTTARIRGHYERGSPAARERERWESEQVDRFRNQMPTFTSMLGNLRPETCPFNPFRAGPRRPIY